MAMKHACNVTNVGLIALNVIRRREVYNSVGKHFRTFSTWWTRTGSSNTSQYTALSKIVGQREELFYSFRRINPIVCMPTVCDYWLRIKLITNGSNRK